MAENILIKIIDIKKQKLEELKKTLSIDSLNKKIDENINYFDFKEKIEKNIKNNKISLIAEIKKASPSAGIIIDNYNPVDIAKIYLDNKATCLSVLTEEDFFLGNIIHMHKIKQKIIEPFVAHILSYVHQQLCPFLYILCTIFVLTFVMTVIILVVILNKKLNIFGG